MAAEDAGGTGPQRAPVRGSAYYFVLILATTAGLGAWASRSPAELVDADLIVWVLLIGGIELLPVPATSRIELTVSFPLLVAVIILYPPPVAGLVALLCSLDMGDFDRSTQPIISLFNRAQAALSMVAAGVCFHAFATLDSPLPVLVPATVLAAALLYGVSFGVVAAAMSLNFRLPFLDVLRRGLGAAPLDLVVSYLGLGLFGIVVAKVAVSNGIWSVLVLMGVIVLTRHLYFRNTALSNRLSEQNTLLTDQAGQLERLLAEVRDNEERFRSLVQNGSDVITVVLPDSTVTYQTPSVERVLGYGPEELVGSGLVELLHPDDRAPAAPSWRRPRGGRGSAPSSSGACATATGAGCTSRRSAATCSPTSGWAGSCSPSAASRSGASSPRSCATRPTTTGLPGWPTGCCSASGSATRSAGPAWRPAPWRSCSSTSTTSRSSTTRSATKPATTCCSPSPSGCTPPYGPWIRPPGSAGTSSRSCSKASGAPRRPPPRHGASSSCCACRCGSRARRCSCTAASGSRSTPPTTPPRTCCATPTWRCTRPRGRARDLGAVPAKPARGHGRAPGAQRRPPARDRA